jgi:hypothetical protein
VKTEPITDVLFRKDRKDPSDIYAIMPSVPADVRGLYVTVYSPVGQHSSGDLLGMISTSRPAKPREAASLKLELERIGYRLRVLQRTPRDAYAKLKKALEQP